MFLTALRYCPAMSAGTYRAGPRQVPLLVETGAAWKSLYLVAIKSSHRLRASKPRPRIASTLNREPLCRPMKVKAVGNNQPPHKARVERKTMRLLRECPKSDLVRPHSTICNTQTDLQPKSKGCSSGGHHVHPSCSHQLPPAPSPPSKEPAARRGGLVGPPDLLFQPSHLQAPPLGSLPAVFPWPRPAKRLERHQVGQETANSQPRPPSDKGVHLLVAGRRSCNVQAP